MQSVISIKTLFRPHTNIDCFSYAFYFFNYGPNNNNNNNNERLFSLILSKMCIDLLSFWIFSLRLADILVRPTQRLTKYGLLLAAIRKHITDENDAEMLDSMVCLI